MKRDPRVPLRDADRSAAEIADHVAGTDLDGFLGNDMLRRAVERNLGIIGEALNRLERDSPAVAARLPDLPNAVGLRNLPAHGHDAIVLETVWNAAVNRLPGLRRSVRSLLAELDRGGLAPDPRHADEVPALSAHVDAVREIHEEIASRREEIAEVCRRHRVRRLEIFGSAARATDFDPARSDADFLVQYDSSEDCGFFGRHFDLKEALSAVLGRQVDLLERLPENEHLRASINECREVVYEA